MLAEGDDVGPHALDGVRDLQLGPRAAHRAALVVEGGLEALADELAPEGALVRRLSARDLHRPQQLRVVLELGLESFGHDHLRRRREGQRVDEARDGAVADAEREE
eukprot:3625825-Alexandrium_andersonii.AAC.1